MAVLGPLYDDISEVVTNNTDLSASPQIIDAKVQPDTDINRRFSLDVQTANTGKYRDRTQMRMAYALQVNFAIRMHPNRQADSYKDSMQIEEDVIDALLVQSRLEAVRVLYERTVRTLTTTREYLFVSVQFGLEGDYAVTS